MEIICNNELLILSADRAIYWPRKKTLILADMHLGKTGYFRARGIQIPATVMNDDLHRLSGLIEAFQPEKIIIAGDMFHHDYNADIALFKKWRDAHVNTVFMLVPGNHDKLLNIDYQDLDIRVTPKIFSAEPFVITHQPSENPLQFEINGHVHPGYIMAGKARQSLRLPCFVITEKQIILPAFSLFTGLYTGYAVSPSNKYYLIGKGTIFCI